jgi:hypothetical protein
MSALEANENRKSFLQHSKTILHLELVCARSKYNLYFGFIHII